VTAEFRPAQVLNPNAPAPFYLAADCRLARPVETGETILMADLELDESSDLMMLRRRQDALFFG
jgi:predicted homoserine dehydrogenase-like protein